MNIDSPDIFVSFRIALPSSDPCQSTIRPTMVVSPQCSTCKGEFVMVLDTEAYIALGFLISILVVTGGLLYFLLVHMKR